MNSKKVCLSTSPLSATISEDSEGSIESRVGGSEGKVVVDEGGEYPVRDDAGSDHHVGHAVVRFKTDAYPAGGGRFDTDGDGIGVLIQNAVVVESDRKGGGWYHRRTFVASPSLYARAYSGSARAMIVTIKRTIARVK